MSERDGRVTYSLIGRRCIAAGRLPADSAALLDVPT